LPIRKGAFGDGVSALDYDERMNWAKKSDFFQVIRLDIEIVWNFFFFPHCSILPVLLAGRRFLPLGALKRAGIGLAASFRLTFSITSHVKGTDVAQQTID